ncbi:MAG: hypothetical protein AAF845_06215 [Bacteroidota bacterium]
MRLPLCLAGAMLLLGGCVLDETQYSPSRTVVFDLAFPEAVEVGTVVDVRFWTDACPEAASGPFRAFTHVPARLDAGDPRDRERRVFTDDEDVLLQCVSLVPVIPLVGLQPPDAVERLSAGLDSVWVDIDLPVGLGLGNGEPYVVTASF